MCGYWESSHIRKRLGDLMLARVFGSPSQQAAVLLPDDFGRRLTPANVDSNMVRIREEGVRYRYSHPFEVDEVEREAELASLRPLSASQLR